MSKFPEILAPAGSFESVAAAVRCGADAVYFGGKAFNARRNAANFEGEEITKAIEYCHARGVKVYITLNTLAADRELDAVCDEIREMCEAGADAFIIQDLGIASLVREICPDIPVHASTQMTVNSPDGVEIIKNMGFKRTVVPREFTEGEIKNLSAKTDIELECFVHGALCMCLSGQCLMSSVIGGRSGNRGLCAQPCRLEFGVNSKGGNNLSLKDLYLIDRIPALAEDGICSLKIEGRMKRPEYVAAAVTACRNSREGKEDKEINDALGAVFSRSGFTSGYFDDKRGKDMFGIRTKDDVVSAAEVLGTLSHLYDNENPLIPVEMQFTLCAGKPAELVIKTANCTVSVKSENIPDKAINREITANDAAARLSKCGGTQFYAQKVVCDIVPGLNMPVSALNSLRREGLALLEKEISKKEKYTLREAQTKVIPHKTSGKRKLFIRFCESDSIPKGIEADRIIIPLSTPDEKVKELVNSGAEIAAEIPVYVFSNADNFRERLLELKALGVSLAAAGNLDGIGIAKSADMPFACSFGMNIYNSKSIETLEKLGAADCLVSSELPVSDISKLGGELPRGALIYGRLPLMVTRNCPVKNKLSCAQCGRKSALVDRLGVRFPVRCSDGFSFIYNSVPVCMTDRLDEIKNTDYDLLYFTTESKEEILKIAGDYREGAKPDYEFTRGLYYRNVL